MNTWISRLCGGALAVCLMGAGAALAAPCSIVDVTTSTACIGPVTGNDSVTSSAGANVNINTFDFDSDTVLGAFNTSDWALLARVNDPATVDGVLTITNPGGQSGTWSATGLDAFNKVMIGIKGGTEFALYLIDVAASSLGGGLYGGDWSMAGLNNAGGSGNPPGHSHLSLYTSGTVQPIPLPAAGWLLLAGAGGLGLLARRRKSA